MDVCSLDLSPVSDGYPVDIVTYEKVINAEVQSPEDRKSKDEGEVKVLPVQSLDSLRPTPSVDTLPLPQPPPPSPVDTWKTRQREVVRAWPRAPNGKELSWSDLSKFHAENSPNQFPWATSLQHIYTVECTLGSSIKWISSGSAITRWMKENGEAEFAMDELSLAADQEPPMIIPVYPHDRILKMEEAAIRSRGNNSGTPLHSQEAKTQGSESQSDGSALQALNTWPWPLVPFSYRPQKLRTRLPCENLPETLIVHDPWNALKVRSNYGRAIPHDTNAEWTSNQKDSTLIYKLKLQSERATVTDDSTLAGAATESFIVRVSRGCRSSQAPFLIRVLHDAPPASNTSQAHLYISPAKFLGSGHHSSVYSCEWEIPRSLLSPHPRFILCRVCVIEDIRRKLEVRRRSQRLEKKSGKRNGTSLVESEPMIIEECEEGSHNKDIRSIRTTVSWQETSRPSCGHLKENANYHVPDTARVLVAAKLSFQGDTHLEQEARNYQAFDSHLFEHWSGLNIVPGIEDPVPVGAIVPQFYGYYVPEDASIYQGYRSPILLLEDCGVKVDTARLTLDQKHEAASLFYRFSSAGWVHGSVFDRNIVMQPGPLNELLGTHLLSLQKGSLSFRLIDFGRSYHKTKNAHSFTEDMLFDKEEVQSLFGI